MFNGKRLRNLRKEKGLTMKDLGKKFSLAESTISGYENETRKPDLETVDKFADFFEVSADYLMGRSVSKATSGGSAYMDGGKGWTEEEKQVADAAIQAWREMKKKQQEQQDK
ncbi:MULTISPECIES: helix-turn-helix domain-containing protein [Paenibacillus]|uniref:helix-turn-helix domain-containing protein n=1 Tax=Paenibacillus TaxID=44249 RepID=UPI000CFBC29A|nr:MULTISPECIES: helix-turn-helix transcriptional regulator [Paenibacillus]MCL6661736.1 helix-turn-helix domain-containing protein [Paenibacillus amylolyticus]PRA04867.1 transcriptional regulator [Paenibacillus sp. MYb63]PRA47788.1 transcriptional regulator [Paenibacillus sp. MYb67]